MENANLAESHLLTDEMDVDLNVLGTAMVDRVGCHIDSADVVTVDNCGDLQWNMKFLKKLSKPTALCDHMSNSPVLGLCTGPGHRGLPFGRPGHQAVAEEDAEAGGGAARVGAPCPVSVGVGNQLVDRPSADVEAS